MLALNPRLLQEARLAAGLTQRAAAERLAISRTTIVNVEQGHTSPSTAVLAAMASAYGVSIDDLFEEVTCQAP